MTIPKHKAVVVHDHLLHGNVSISKVEEEGHSCAVSVTVANRTLHPPPSNTDFAEEEQKIEPKRFVLCAITFESHLLEHPFDEIDEGTEERLPALHHPHHPPHPVIIAILVCAIVSTLLLYL